MAELEIPCICPRNPGGECDGNCDTAEEAKELALKSKRSAIVERREAVQSLARPSRLGSTDIIGEVAEVRETMDLYKLYRPEWIRVFASNTGGDPGKMEAEAFFNERFEGRVRDEDIRYTPSSRTNPDAWPYFLELRLPNIKGEFKTKALAEKYKEERGWDDAQIVSRNSRDEHVLKEYGKKKLPKVR